MDTHWDSSEWEGPDLDLGRRLRRVDGQWRIKIETQRNKCVDGVGHQMLVFLIEIFQRDPTHRNVTSILFLFHFKYYDTREHNEWRGSIEPEWTLFLTYSGSVTVTWHVTRVMQTSLWSSDRGQEETNSSFCVKLARLLCNSAAVCQFHFTHSSILMNNDTKNEDNKWLVTLHFSFLTILRKQDLSSHDH